ncbi:hypothetical protein [Silvanigrella sp.]|jgi:MFS family permease|uniref:hypothetical protein n=1 Tax=Silvanigrella sp. TaxID=2024976 RepID=UPI0037CC242B
MNLTNTNIKKSALIFTSTSLEYFEFSIFLFLSGIISKQYFGDFSFSLPILFIIITAVGKFVGGTTLAAAIDKLGALIVYKFTMTLTAICSILLLILPNYNSLGVLAGILFIVIRFIQIAAASAEAASAVVLSDSNFENKPYASALVCAAFIFGCGVANLIANYINPDYFKILIFASALLLFSFRWFMKSSNLKDSKPTYIKREINFEHVKQVFLIGTLLSPTLLIQFFLFGFSKQEPVYSAILVVIYVAVAILSTALLNKFNGRFGYYFPVNDVSKNVRYGFHCLILMAIVAGAAQTSSLIFKFILVVPFALYLSSIFGVVLKYIDGKRRASILTCGAAIGNLVAVLILQNFDPKYLWILIIGVILTAVFALTVFEKKSVQAIQELS